MDYIGVYADEGINATNTTKRAGFKQMVADALDGKFDRILTKSVSCFVRNTVDSLTAIRQLKEKGVSIYFEKENIDTFDSKGELMITLMSSLTQGESRSISQNTTWGQRKRFSDSKLIMPFSHFHGYDRGEDGKPVINEDEAKVVRLIYKLYLDGKSTSSIARYLMKQGVPTPGGADKWQTTTINSILQNEKYRGDAILQKKFTVDFLTKKMKKNEGEVQQYYVHNSHPAIISSEVFDLAQMERRRRQEGHIRICSGSVFANNIQIGEQGTLRRLFKDARGNEYFIREVFAVHPDFIPNVKRDYFNENVVRDKFEKQIREFFDYLWKLCNIASEERSAYRAINDYTQSVTLYKEKARTGLAGGVDREVMQKSLDDKKQHAEKAQGTLQRSSETDYNDVTSRLKAIVRNSETKQTPLPPLAELPKIPFSSETCDDSKKEKPAYVTDELSQFTKETRRVMGKIYDLINQNAPEIVQNLIAKIHEG